MKLFAVAALLLLACPVQAGTLQDLYFTVPEYETPDECNPQQMRAVRDTTPVTVVVFADKGWTQRYLQVSDVVRGVRQRIHGWSGLPGGTWVVTTKVVEREKDLAGKDVDLIGCWGNKITAISFGF